jgi:biopolymer transport protein ExbD
MARHRRVQNLEEDKPELSISPLIDVCFLLLIYFLVTTTIKQKERDNNMMLPSAAPSEAQPEIQPFFIRINAEGQIYANVGAAEEMLDREAVGPKRELPILDQRVDIYSQSAKAGNDQPLVQIYVEGEAEHQSVMDVLNVLAKYEITTVTFTDLLTQDQLKQ